MDPACGHPPAFAGHPNSVVAYPPYLMGQYCGRAVASLVALTLAGYPMTLGRVPAFTMIAIRPKRTRDGVGEADLKAGARPIHSRRAPLTPALSPLGRGSLAECVARASLLPGGTGWNSWRVGHGPCAPLARAALPPAARARRAPAARGAVRSHAPDRRGDGEGGVRSQTSLPV